MSVRKPLLVRATFILLIVGFLSSLAIIPTAAIGQTNTFNPIADAYVNSSNPGTNYGSGPTMRVDGSPVLTGYLRFNVAGLGTPPISQALLKIYSNSSSPDGLVVMSVADDNWGETGINYNNAPALGSMVTSSAAVSTGSWITLDVTSYITRSGMYSFGVSTPGTTAISLASWESGANAPQLIVTVNGSSTPVPTQSPPPSGSSNILLIAGDICKHDLGGTDYTPLCKKTGDLVRSVLAANPGGQVLTLGDNVNNDTGGSAYDSQYRDLFAPNWGSFLNVTRSVEGNHDIYPPSGTAPYFAYFGSAAGPQPGGYYSYTIGSAWHVIVLNAECSQAGGCGSGSPQYTWLKNDLAANTSKCVLTAWHQPRWTSGRHSDDSSYAAWWTLLYQYKVDIIANGHNHNYERFNLINPSEQAASDGIREFVVGTGGAPGDGYSYASHPLDPNEVVRNQSTVYGVLKLTLSDGSYSWTFLPAAGYSFTDSGTTTCH